MARRACTTRSSVPPPAIAAARCVAVRATVPTSTTESTPAPTVRRSFDVVESMVLRKMGRARGGGYSPSCSSPRRSAS